ncbi:MAG: PAS domain S-box protein, partial [Candidatus Bathyarchaeota archaeon]|nr:PAS domain S-box protein [Candidatus Bathyarchaeota archaeon]
SLPKAIKGFLGVIRGKPIRLELELKTAFKKTVLVEVTSKPLIINGKTVGTLGIARNITERKQATEALKQAEEKHRTMLDTANVLIQSVSAEGKFVYVNKEWKKVLGYTDKDLKKITLMDVIRKDYRKHCMDIFKQVVKGKSVRDVEAVFVAKDGEEIMVSGNARSMLKDGEFVSTVGFFANVTERRQMEEKLQEYSERLEELVEKRTRQLKEAHEQLLKAERFAAIGEMAAMVGHDLRNPLTGIAGATYYLKTKLGPKMDKKSREMLELVEKSIGYSNKIISDLLEYSREIRLELTETTPKSITKDSLTLIKIPKNIRISDLTENKPKIKVDVPKIERAFVNIIKNAIAAMSKGGTLTITSKESNGNLEISFTDTGVGIPKEVMEKIWIPLFTTKAKGMGLGLPICKRIVEAHGGNISVESTVNKGTTFTVTIPIKPKIEGGEKIWVNVPESLLSTTTKA